jgi:NAD(P)-dependent dehydrogenase (short-subunit alcohol dehydrogenase family)
MNLSVDLSGQVALVTGGGRGLGRKFAQAMADAGASVMLVARSSDQLDDTVRLIAETGGQAMAYPGDVTDGLFVENIVNEVEKRLGHIDILVNNAGIAPPVGPLWETDPEVWWRNIEVNLWGPLLFSRYTLPNMISRRSGRIINIASVAGLSGIPNFSAYVTCKTTLIRFSETLSLEAREHGVSVFAISPGTVRTSMSEGGMSPEGLKWLPWMAKIFEDGRDVPPDLTVNLLLQLASGRADALSGCYIHITDNLNELIKREEEIQQAGAYRLRLKKT